MPDVSAVAPSVQYHSVDDEQSLVTVDLDVKELEKLSADALAGLNSLPRRGLEIGGVLLGHVEANLGEPDAGKPRMVVDGFCEVESEHLFGPSYRLSDKDRLVWRETLLKLSSGEKGKSAPVGLFRSTTAGQFELDEQDFDLINSLEDVLVSDLGERVFLLLKPVKSGANEGRVAIWQEGATRTFPPFPLHLRRAPKREPATVPFEKVTNLEAATEPPAKEKAGSGIKGVPSWGDDEAERHTSDQTVREEPAPAQQFVKPSIVEGPCRAWISLSAATCVMLVASGSYLLSHRESPFSAKKIAAPAAANERPAALASNPEQLSHSPFDANASTPVQEPSLPTSDAISREDRPADSIESGAVYRRTRRVRDEDDEDDDTPPARTESSSQNPPNLLARTQGPAQALPNQQPQEQHTEPLAMTVPLNSEEEKPGGPHVGQAFLGNPSEFRTRGTQATPEFTMQVDPPSKTRAIGSVLSKLSPLHWIKKVRGGDGGPETPKPVYAVQPEIPQRLRSLLQGGERVDVRVAINKSGKVMKAVASSQGEARQRWLAASVLAAAYQWEFRPAKISKEPVESAALIHFVFHNGSSTVE